MRYGIELVPEPSFAARAYRARQLICGQYGSWAAEMLMVHLTVADFFQCPDSAVGAVATGLARIAAQSHTVAPRFNLSHQGVATFPNMIGTIFLDFTHPNGYLGARSPSSGPPIYTLHHNVIDLLQNTPGVVPGLRFAGSNYWPHLTLMLYANLAPTVFEDAVQFARAVVVDLLVPATTQAWRLMLVRFESNAAGDDWDNGRWAADLRWSLLSSHPL